MTEKLPVVMPGNFLSKAIIYPQWWVVAMLALIAVLGVGWTARGYVGGFQSQLVTLAHADTVRAAEAKELRAQMQVITDIVPVVRGLASIVCQQSPALAGPIFRGTIAQCDVPLVSPPGDWGRK